MPREGGVYTKPTGGWVNDTDPAINETEMNAISDTLECVGIANGGTGATTARGARQNIGLVSIGSADTPIYFDANGDPKAISSPLPVAKGGTGGATAQNARKNLGLQNVGATNTPIYFDANGDPKAISAALPIAKGGTGGTTAKTARTNLGFGSAGATNRPVYFNSDGLPTPITGALPVAYGGTGATTLAGVRNALGLGNTTGALPIANGGTGATTVAAARNNLGLGNTSGALPIANGGTGATTAKAARTNLGFGAAGSTTRPVYFTADGVPAAITGAIPFAYGGSGQTGTSSAAGSVHSFYKWGKVVMYSWIAATTYSAGATARLEGVIASAYRPVHNVRAIIPVYRTTSSAGDQDITGTAMIYISTDGTLSFHMFAAGQPRGEVTYLIP